MKPHKYFRSKKAQIKRIKEYNKIFKGTQFKELHPAILGRLKKHNYADCGRAKCGICSYEKLFKPIGKQLRKEGKQKIDEEFNDYEDEINYQMDIWEKQHYDSYINSIS